MTRTTLPATPYSKVRLDIQFRLFGPLGQKFQRVLVSNNKVAPSDHLHFETPSISGPMDTLDYSKVGSGQSEQWEFKLTLHDADYVTPPFGIECGLLRGAVWMLAGDWYAHAQEPIVKELASKNNPDHIQRLYFNPTDLLSQQWFETRDTYIRRIVCKQTIDAIVRYTDSLAGFNVVSRLPFFIEYYLGAKAAGRARRDIPSITIGGVFDELKVVNVELWEKLQAELVDAGRTSRQTQSQPILDRLTEIDAERKQLLDRLAEINQCNSFD